MSTAHHEIQWKRNLLIRGRAFLMAAMAWIVIQPAHAADWSGFRGPNGNGISREKEVFPNSPFGLEIAWQKKLGSGYSGVAIAEGYVVTACSDGTSDVLVAMDEQTGNERWRFTLDKTYEGHDGSHTGPIATPLIADGRVFMLAPRGQFVAVNLKDGKKIWATELTSDQGSSKPHYGFTTSALLHKGVLIIQTGDEAAVAGFNPANGKRLWTAGKDKIQYQSPVVTSLLGKTQVVAGGDTKIIGVDSKTGDSLWEYTHAGGGAIGASSMVPVPVGNNRLFLSHKRDKSTVIEVKKEGGKTDVKSLWENNNIRNSYNAPVSHDGYIYAYSSRFLTCIDASDGEAKWRSRQPGDGFTALVDGHLVILTKAGSVHVAKASPDGYEELASVQAFEDQAWAPPSFANGHVVVKGLGGIARIAVRKGSASQAEADALAAGQSSNFAQFLKEASNATNKKDVVDQFMKNAKQFPITEDGMVHFVYRGTGNDLAVGSDLFGARQERAMQRLEGTNLFYASVPIENDARVNYLFIRDFEDHLTDPRNPRKTTTALFGKEMEMSFSGATMDMSWFGMPGWKAPTYFETASNSRKGTIEEQSITSKLEGKPVAVSVYLPAGYKKSKDRYPVAYFHVGNDAMDRGDVPKALDNLIGDTVAPIIVVFIKHVPPPFRPNKYEQMFTDELIPFIDKTYRTVASPEGRASLGAGFGGGMAIQSALAGSIHVTNVGCLSPILFGVPIDAIGDQMGNAKDRGFHVYLDWGRYDFRNPQEAWDMGKTTSELSEIIEDKGIRVSGGELHEGTGWSSWRNRLGHMFGSLFPKT